MKLILMLILIILASCSTEKLTPEQKAAARRESVRQGRSPF
jgi:hypothetical protein